MIYSSRPMVAAWLAVASLGWLCFASGTYAGCPIQLRDVTAGTGITFRRTDGSSGRRYIVEYLSAGLALFDYDGDLDVVILNSRREPTILRNDSPPGNHWLQVRLQGTKTNRDGVGARVRVVADGLTQIDEVHSGRGYLNHYGTWLHFGLGRRDGVDRIDVRWIGGGVDVVEKVQVDRVLAITEGGSRTGTRWRGIQR